MSGINVDVNDMAKVTGIPSFKIKEALGIPISATCAASTVEEAERACNNAPSGSEAKKVALERWNKLSLKEAVEASTVEEVRKAYNNAPRGSEAEKAALEKWNKLSLKEVGEASTVEEAEKAYRNAPIESEAEKAALKRWILLASTVEEAVEVYKKAHEDVPGSEIEKLAIIKLATFFPKENSEKNSINV